MHHRLADIYAKKYLLDIQDFKHLLRPARSIPGNTWILQHPYADFRPAPNISCYFRVPVGERATHALGDLPESLHSCWRVGLVSIRQEVLSCGGTMTTPLFIFLYTLSIGFLIYWLGLWLVHILAIIYGWVLSFSDIFWFLVIKCPFGLKWGG